LASENDLDSVKINQPGKYRKLLSGHTHTHKQTNKQTNTRTHERVFSLDH